MKILAVTGATSKTGKTALIRRLIPLLPGWAVCKVTTCFHHPGGSVREARRIPAGSAILWMLPS